MENRQSDEVERLIQELADPDRNVRSRAAYELGKFEDVPAIEALVRAMRDPDKFVRMWSATALSKIGRLSIGPLIEALEDTDPAVSHYAALALGELGDLRAVPQLVQAIQHGDWEVRSNAAATLNKLGDPETLPFRVLGEEGLSAEQKVDALEALHEVRYRDESLDLHFSVPDVAAFCRQMPEQQLATVTEGAIAVLAELERRANLLPVSAPEPASPSRSEEPDVTPETPAQPENEAPSREEAAVVAPSAGATEESAKRGLFSRLFRKS